MPGLAAIDKTPLGIEVAGTAAGFDEDGDGTMDEMRAGIWTGAVYAGSEREPDRRCELHGPPRRGSFRPRWYSRRASAAPRWTQFDTGP